MLYCHRDSWVQRKIASLSIGVLLSLSWFFLSCESPVQYERVNYRQRVILSYLLTPPADPNASCLSFYRNAEACLSRASNIPSPPRVIVEATLAPTVAISPPFSVPTAQISSLSNYTSACTAILATPFFSRSSNAVRACIFNCLSSYYETKSRENSCSQDFTALISGSFTGTTRCFRNCVQTNNTDVWN